MQCPAPVEVVCVLLPHLLLVGGAHELQLGVLSGRVVVHGDVPGTLTNEIHS